MLYYGDSALNYLLPKVILELSLSQKLSCLIPGVQSSTVTVITLYRTDGAGAGGGAGVG